jgi:ubiquinone/menaquinone biosynthesis C-methylase UbiE
VNDGVSEVDPHSHGKKAEQAWQDEEGGALQVQAYGRAGTRMVFHRQFCMVSDALGLAPSQRILDLGCGVGLFLSWLSRGLDARLYGLDVSLGSLSLARQRTSALHLVAGDAEVLPYANGSFDRVACNGAAHHLPDVETMLREVWRVLLPGGRLALYEPTTTAFSNMIRKFSLRFDRFESPADLEHKHDLHPEALRASLRASGFENVSISYHDWLAYPLSGMYMDLPVGHWRGAIVSLLHAEERLERWRAIKPLADALSWRVMVVATKPLLVPSPSWTG